MVKIVVVDTIFNIDFLDMHFLYIPAIIKHRFSNKRITSDLLMSWIVQQSAPLTVIMAVSLILGQDNLLFACV